LKPEVKGKGRKRAKKKFRRMGERGTDIAGILKNEFNIDLPAMKRTVQSPSGRNAEKRQKLIEKNAMKTRLQGKGLRRRRE